MIRMLSSECQPGPCSGGKERYAGGGAPLGKGPSGSSGKAVGDGLGGPRVMAGTEKHNQQYGLVTEPGPPRRGKGAGG